MSESYIFEGMEAGADSLVIEGFHKPGSLTTASGAWIHAAGSAMLLEGDYTLHSCGHWVWLSIADGEGILHWGDLDITLEKRQNCFILVE